jgi:hypothetical protein
VLKIVKVELDRVTVVVGASGGCNTHNTFTGAPQSAATVAVNPATSNTEHEGMARVAVGVAAEQAPPGLNRIWDKAVANAP